MISVDRSAVRLPPALDGDDSKAARELQAARLHFQQQQDGSFPFKVYKDKTVKDALEQLFHGKCAYCETYYAGSQPGDVEHYRPKSVYWWLAASWENLLPSCIDCNRRRHQQEVGGGTALLGKADQFPIADESKRAGKEGDESHEQPLIFDPCRDRPEGFLLFGDGGEVKARDGISELDRKRVEASLEVYGLNRNGLASQRRDHTVDLGGKMSTVGNAAKAWTTNHSETSRTELADLARQLLRKRDAKAAYAGLSRQFADPVLTRMRSFVEKHFGADLEKQDGDPDDVLERFVERFATREVVKSQVQSALDALAL